MCCLLAVHSFLSTAVGFGICLVVRVVKDVECRYCSGGCRNALSPVQSERRLLKPFPSDASHSSLSITTNYHHVRTSSC